MNQSWWRSIHRRWKQLERSVLVVKPAPQEVDTTAHADEDDAQWMTRGGDLLRRDHDELDRRYEDLLAAYRSGDWNEVRAEWDVFEAALRAHLATEERHVFPRFRDEAPDEERALRREHEELRRMLTMIGVGIDLHAVPERDAEELVRRLRDHAARENALLYRWMDRAAGAVRVASAGPSSSRSRVVGEAGLTPRT